MPADQRDRVYRGVLDDMIGYELLMQEAKARKVAVADAGSRSAARADSLAVPHRRAVPAGAGRAEDDARRRAR